MDEILTQDLKKQFNSLPVDVQSAISNVDLASKLQEIVKNNKLMIDQAGGLEMETVLVLFGLEPLENFVNNLIKDVGLSSIQASVVAHDVNESIFKSVRETLKKINNEITQIEKEEGGIVETTKNVTPSSEELLSRENILAGIEHPENIKTTEKSVSVNPIQTDNTKPEIHPEMEEEGIEIRVNKFPEVAPKIPLPAVSSLIPKQAEPFHINIPPIDNIVESKMTSTVVVPKETIIVPDKTKLPEKPKTSGDPYRESII